MCPVEVPLFFFSGSSALPHAAGELFTKSMGKDTNRMRSDEPEWRNNWLIEDECQRADRPSPHQDGVIQRVS